jgi:peptidoglycan/LPS O-acetylase OafA/YrhL
VSQAVPPERPHAAVPPDPRRRAVLSTVAVMLAVPFVALLWVSSYAKDDPRLFGFPFFYWYQFLWVVITAALTAIALAMVRSVSRKPPSFDDRYDDRGVRQRGGRHDGSEQ